MQNEWTEYTDVPRGRCRRRALRRHARDGRHARRRARAHGQRLVVVAAALQRRRGGRDRHQRRALRRVGLSGRARHRRRGRLPRRPAAARRRAHDRGGQEGPRPLQRAPVPGAARARADRGRRRGVRSRPRRPSRRTTRARPARSSSTSTPRITSRSTATAPASRSPARARSPPGPTTGGRPGASSSSDSKLKFSPGLPTSFRCRSSRLSASALAAACLLIAVGVFAGTSAGSGSLASRIGSPAARA